MSTSWARLLAASGLVTIVYTTRTPATDVHAVLQHIRQNAASLGVDAQRIGLLAASANVAVALSALMQDPDLKCAALLYGFTLDLDGSTTIAEMSRTFGFANACAGRSMDDLPSHTPLFVVRAVDGTLSALLKAAASEDGRYAEAETCAEEKRWDMTKRAKHIVAALIVFVVMTLLAVLFGLGPVVSSAA